MENVKPLLSKTFLPVYHDHIQIMESLGYNSFTSILNSKDYGIPQNRERVFCVSILGNDHSYEFPTPKELKLRLKDMLEDGVDEKYYLSERMIKYITSEDDKYKVNKGGVTS